MWILAGAGYISQHHITRLEEDHDGDTVIHLADGTTVTSTASIDSITTESGITIAARAGFEEVWLSDDYSVNHEPIVGWRITDGGAPIAVTPSGMAKAGSVGWGILYPDGRIFDKRRECFYRNVESWVTYVRETTESEKKCIERKLKAVGGAQ
jgi:hypothetical protein